MIDNKKEYFGQYEDPILSAQIYDIALIQTKGFDIEINFAYSKAQILSILFE